jgi:hypothetical protein
MSKAMPYHRGISIRPRGLPPVNSSSVLGQQGETSFCIRLFFKNVTSNMAENHREAAGESPKVPCRSRSHRPLLFSDIRRTASVFGTCEDAQTTSRADLGRLIALRRVFPISGGRAICEGIRGTKVGIAGSSDSEWACCRGQCAKSIKSWQQRLGGGCVCFDRYRSEASATGHDGFCTGD